MVKKNKRFIGLFLTEDKIDELNEIVKQNKTDYPDRSKLLRNLIDKFLGNNSHKKYKFKRIDKFEIKNNANNKK